MIDTAAAPERLRLAAREEALDSLFPWLAAAAARLGVPQALRPRLHLALEEAVSNIIRHGVAPHEGGAASHGGVAISLERDGEGARIVIEDGTAPFDPAAATLPPLSTSLGDARPGGTGLRLLRHACDAIHYAPGPATNRLTLVIQPRG